jgi:hypothetical protein
METHIVGQAEQAIRIARIIRESLGKPPTGNFTVTSRGGCVSCDPGSCPECGYLFTGDIITIEHKTKGKRTLSDKAIHYLSHGIISYKTGYVINGETVVVDLDPNEIASYLDL